MPELQHRRCLPVSETLATRTTLPTSKYMCTVGRLRASADGPVVVDVVRVVRGPPQIRLYPLFDPFHRIFFSSTRAYSTSAGSSACGPRRSRWCAPLGMIMTGVFIASTQKAAAVPRVEQPGGPDDVGHTREPVADPVPAEGLCGPHRIWLRTVPLRQSLLAAARSNVKFRMPRAETGGAFPYNSAHSTVPTPRGQGRHPECRPARPARRHPSDDRL